MSLVKALFGPSREEIWRQLSREVGGQFHEGGFFTPSAVQARTHDWIITLDTHTQGDGNTNVTSTRLRAPYFNPEGFRFEIYRASIFSGPGKALGMQDIEVGHPRFDREFVIKGNAPRRVLQLRAPGHKHGQACSSGCTLRRRSAWRRHAREQLDFMNKVG